MSRIGRCLVALMVLVGLGGIAPVAQAADVREYTGTIDGARFLVKVPADWNGKLLLYSHGLYPVGYVPEQIELVNQKAAEPELLDRGYALAASLYRNPGGYSVPDATRDQVKLLRWFDRKLGAPRRVIAWGASGGGLDSVLLGERNPARIDGVLAMCGPVAGAGRLWDGFLDYGHTIRTLLAPELKLTGLRDPAANDAAASAALRRALGTPQGRARLALANAFAGVPGWSHALEPRPTGVAAQIRQQGEMDLGLINTLVFGAQRADLEARAGGSPNSNVGVDYRALLARARQPLVRKAYRAAGLDLDGELRRLNRAPRTAAKPGARAWLARNGQPSGRSAAPVLTLHPVADGITVAQERGYTDLARRTDLRQLYLNRAGHCMHTAAEELTALRVLERRLDRGHWPSTGQAALNRQAGTYGPKYHRLFDWIVNKQGSARPAFLDYRPPLPPRG